MDIRTLGRASPGLLLSSSWAWGCGILVVNEDRSHQCSESESKTRVGTPLASVYASLASLRAGDLFSCQSQSSTGVSLRADSVELQQVRVNS